MATPFLELDSGSNLDITTEQATGSYTAPADGLFGCDFRISSMNNAAATITARLAHTTSGNTLIRSFYFSLPKFAATDTVFGWTFQPVPVKSGEKLVLYLQSTNASDTAVTWQVDWFDGMAADAVKVSGDITAADNFETMLDGTGGKKLTLEQLRINSTSAGGAIDIDNSSYSGVSINGGTAALLIENDKTNFGAVQIYNANAAGVALHVTGGGVGFYAGGAAAGMSVQGTGVGGVGLIATPNFAGEHTGSIVGDLIGNIVGDFIGDLSGSVGSVTDPVALTEAYDPAKTAAQAGDAMTLTEAYDAAKTAAQAGDQTKEL